VSTDRLEQVLYDLQELVTRVRIDVAHLLARSESAETAARTAAGVAKALSDHESQDARVHGELLAEVRRLWWLAGIALTVSSIAAALGLR
jgi:ubiquinone biosynthesis protein UbiJ